MLDAPSKVLIKVWTIMVLLIEYYPLGYCNSYLSTKEVDPLALIPYFFYLPGAVPISLLTLILLLTTLLATI
jgi:hypothetical protein